MPAWRWCELELHNTGGVVSQASMSAVEVNHADIEGLVQGVKLPPQPRIVLMIHDEMKNEEPNFHKISDWLSRDAALSAKVLKVINSPIFGVGRKITSLSQALALMGLRRFHSTVVTSSLREALGGRDEVTERLWEHSVHVAGLCARIAQRSRKASPEEAYMVGLFHDSAAPLLLKKFPGYIEVVEMLVARGGDIPAYEERQFNTDHALVGSIMARSWGLEPAVTEAIRYHHSDDRNVFTNATSSCLWAIIRLADQLSREVAEEGQNRDAESDAWEQLKKQISEELDFDANDFADLRETAADLVGRM